MNKPKLSVVTVVRNGERFLQQTIESVLSQTYPGIEYIVIDGGSTDGTLAIIEQHDESLDYWLSEPDSGIADAMNKGLSLCRGQYVLFLHADDYLISSDCIAIAIEMMVEEPDIAAYAIDFVSEGKHLTLAPRGFGPWLNFKTGLFHQAVLCKRELFDPLGTFDTGFTIAMDYEFWLRAYRRGIKPQLHEHTLSVMRDTGVSARIDRPTLKRRFAEEKKAHSKHARSALDRLAYTMYWSLYPLYRYLKG